jgi:CRP/FNR family transcriptional regulator
MSSLRGLGTRPDSSSPRAREASRRNHARASPLLQSALSRLSTLQVELASSRQQLLDFRRQVESLCGENDRLKRCVAHGDRDAASQSRSNPTCTGIANELTQGLGEEFSGSVRRLLATRVHVRKGEVLFGAGASCAGLYVVRNGSLKTVLLSKDGQTQISAFHLAGDLVGLDGMFAREHDCQVVALEDSDVNHMPLDQLDELARACDHFRQNLYRSLAQEFVRAHALMLSLGTSRADQRVAGYLLEVSRRLHAIGYSSTELNLRMTRREIGSYLGLKLETVSRLLSRLHREGTIGISGRAVRLFNRETLQRIADGEC